MNNPTVREILSACFDERMMSGQGWEVGEYVESIMYKALEKLLRNWILSDSEIESVELYINTLKEELFQDCEFWKRNR